MQWKHGCHTRGTAIPRRPCQRWNDRRRRCGSTHSVSVAIVLPSVIVSVAVICISHSISRRHIHQSFYQSPSISHVVSRRHIHQSFYQSPSYSSSLPPRNFELSVKRGSVGGSSFCSSSPPTTPCDKAAENLQCRGASEHFYVRLKPVQKCVGSGVNYV